MTLALLTTEEREVIRLALEATFHYFGNDLLYGEGIREAEVLQWTGVGRLELQRIFAKWLNARGGPSAASGKGTNAGE